MLADNELSAVVCALPVNVLLLSGYWPVVGKSVATAWDDRIVLLVPEDEAQLASSGWADEVHTFKTGSLDKIVTGFTAVMPILEGVLRRAAGPQARVGFEEGEAFDPAPYVSLHVYGDTVRNWFRKTFPSSDPVPLESALSRARSALTGWELDHVRAACRIARAAFELGVQRLRGGLTETEAAAEFTFRLGDLEQAGIAAQRAGGSAFCMSGPNSAEAHAAYQRSRSRRVMPGDSVLVHCNSFVDGYWTDITRTYFLGEPDRHARHVYESILEARDAAFNKVRPGVAASDVDRAAREVMEARGLGSAFVHGTGHAVGFAAIDHTAAPTIHPASRDVLAPGMVFNIEPAAYFEGQRGFRHCDMVAVTESGAELLTPFHERPDDLITG